LNIGKTGAIGLADARKVVAKTMAAVAEGKDPAAEKKAERTAGTFSDLAVRYVEEYAKKNNKSWEQAAYLIRSYVLPYWSKLQAKSISRADVKALMRRLDNRPALANQVLAATSAIFTWAEREEILATNPCKQVKRNETRSRERVASESELSMVWKALGDSVQGRALKALLLLGQRPGEVSCMRREHIKDGWWEMPGKPVPELKWPGTKNGESHRVWLPKPVRAIIDSDQTVGFVFSQRGRPVIGLDALMRSVSKQFNIEALRPHDLRRTHGTTITKLKFGREAMNRSKITRKGVSPTFTTCTSTLTRTSTSWKRWPHISWRWRRGSPRRAT
jgi:integrase